MLKSNAIVTNVMNGNDYVGGALVLGHSIKRHLKVPCDLICLVTSDVTNDARLTLTKIFDFVIEIEKIEWPCNIDKWKRFKDSYKWIYSCFTKLNAFQLSCYQRILLLDADMMAVGSVDELFTNTFNLPLGTVTGDECSNLELGAVVNRTRVVDSLRMCYGISGCSLLFEPNVKDFEGMLIELTQNKHYGNERFNAGPDEQLVAQYFLKKNKCWHYLPSKYSIPGWKSKLVEGLAKLIPNEKTIEEPKGSNHKGAKRRERGSEDNEEFIGFGKRGKWQSAKRKEREEKTTQLIQPAELTDEDKAKIERRRQRFGGLTTNINNQPSSDLSQLQASQSTETPEAKAEEQTSSEEAKDALESDSTALIHFVTEKPWRSQHGDWADFKLWNAEVRLLCRNDSEKPEKREDCTKKKEKLDNSETERKEGPNELQQNEQTEGTSEDEKKISEDLAASAENEASPSTSIESSASLSTQTILSVSATLFSNWFPKRIFESDPFKEEDSALSSSSSVSSSSVMSSSLPPHPFRESDAVISQPEQHRCLHLRDFLSKRGIAYMEPSSIVPALHS
ncbi:putative Glycosyl transferase family 8 protein [Monocercomonoides exilis]|uniref:putative Glycosyl transferase family 8 protein n=1 Tax=Monocercomonoides exilis TaxID=2049356 RepID=UPI0035597AEB|nr:putative Glycosyl transferase family 8 protein [Monocercomonoides exilis]|eukprot:MONOS_5731.1-p1 / transcript=MONOS_5731.1 / gene=MONOS_5731 / organism=Monocercomonoides_exilis_PA203 / gene_product=Glycosyl transferase family 8 protein / transcript_product=Glycosyl transferase family 8 protein / location=Mono_scaffold00171:51199-53131(-) / protein_length=563 / sequence_SO=supercontig / SO=protein_coding / is_pseudo=false